MAHITNPWDEEVASQWMVDDRKNMSDDVQDYVGYQNHRLQAQEGHVILDIRYDWMPSQEGKQARMYLVISSLVVHPDYRRQNKATQVLEELKCRYKKPLMLNAVVTDQGQAWGQYLVRNHGWIKKEKNYYCLI